MSEDKFNLTEPGIFNSLINLETNSNRKLLITENIDDFLTLEVIKSEFKHKLIKILFFFQKKLFFFILIQYIIGFIFLGLPILIYKYNNEKFPLSFNFLISNIILLLLIIFFLVYRLYNNKKYSISNYLTWERNNILLIIGISLSFLIILLSLILFYFFEKKIKTLQIFFSSENGISCDDEDLIFKFFLLFYFDNPNSKSFSINFGNESKDKIFKEIKKLIFYFLVPFFFFTLIKTTKNIFIKNKFCVEKIIIGFDIIIGIIIMFISWENIFKINLKYVEIFLFLILFLFYLLWDLKIVKKKLFKKKEKKFGIYILPLYYIFLSLISDLIFIIGIFYGFISFIQYLYFSINNNETFENIVSIFYKLKISIILLISGNCFYFGNKFLSVVLNPIVFEFCPSYLKNKNYIKIKKKLNNSFIEEKKSINEIYSFI